MSEPLDFSKVGSKPKSPEGGPKAPRNDPSRRPPGAVKPPKAKGPRPSGRRPPALVLALIAVAVVAVVVFATSRGGDSKKPTPAAVTSAARYCGLAIALDTAAPASRSLDAAGAKAVLDQLGDMVADLRSVAPAEVRADVRAALNSLEAAAAGDAGVLESKEYLANRQHISEYTQMTCTSDPGQEGD